MQAAVLEDIRTISVKEVPRPDPEPGQILVKVALAGICGSDSSLYQGKFNVPLPVIPGHEMVGRVERLGPGVSGPAVGQRVTLQPNIGCGKCDLCRSGHGNLCPQKIRIGVDADGIFAEYAAVPAQYVWTVPDQLDDETAAFTEPMAIVLHAMHRAAPQKESRVLILGAGVIGLLTLQVALLSSETVHACDIVAQRLAMARSLGAGRMIDAGDDQQVEQQSYDLIYETSGSPGGLAQAVRMAAPLSTIVLLGLPAEAHPVSATQIVRKELRILGSLIYTVEFPQALELLAQKRIETRALISGTLPLSGLNAALRNFSAPERIKTLVQIG